MTAHQGQGETSEEERRQCAHGGVLAPIVSASCVTPATGMPAACTMRSVPPV